ncbi:MAG: pYEATS domain-containing protein [Pyrinomonadaceae bacterium]
MFIDNPIKDQLDLKIIDTVFDPNIYGASENPVLPRNAKSDEMKFNVHYYERDGTFNYQVWLFLAGNDLPFVDKVTYQLHESFDEPFRTVNRTPANPDCRLVIWTWGIFQVNANIYDKNNRLYVLTHQLNYGNQLKEFNDKIKSIPENPEATFGATLVA